MKSRQDARTTNCRGTAATWWGADPHHPFWARGTGGWWLFRTSTLQFLSPEGPGSSAYDDVSLLSGHVAFSARKQEMTHGRGHGSGPFSTFVVQFQWDAA